MKSADAGIVQIPDLGIDAGGSLQSFRTADLFGADQQEELKRLVATVIWVLGLSSPGAGHAARR
jgi:hypothetical protein